MTHESGTKKNHCKTNFNDKANFFLCSVMLIKGSLARIFSNSGFFMDQFLPGPCTEAVDMNGRFQMQGGKNWFFAERD